jgi:hypothetical protein
MGLFSDIQSAQQISADDVVSVPAQRIDTVVADPVSGAQRRRTDYAGTAWYGGRPQIVSGQALPGRHAEIGTPFWLPDSHRYRPGVPGDVQIQASAAVQGGLVTSNGGSFQIFDVAAALGEDPEIGGALLVFVAVTAIATLPLGVAYRVTVICNPEALQPPPA